MRARLLPMLLCYGLVVLFWTQANCTYQSDPAKGPLAQAPIVPPTAPKPGQLPAGHPKSSVVEPTEHGPPICGQVVLAPEIALPKQAKSKRYLIAKSAITGSILAVQQLNPTSPFPSDFCLSYQDLLLPGALFQGAMQLLIRIDQDGDPLTEQPGDVSGALLTNVSPGTNQVRLVLDKVVQ